MSGDQGALKHKTQVPPSLCKVEAHLELELELLLAVGCGMSRCHEIAHRTSGFICRVSAIKSTTMHHQGCHARGDCSTTDDIAIYRSLQRECHASLHGVMQNQSGYIPSWGPKSRQSGHITPAVSQTPTKMGWKSTTRNRLTDASAPMRVPTKLWQGASSNPNKWVTKWVNTVHRGQKSEKGSGLLWFCFVPPQNPKCLEKKMTNEMTKKND